MSPKHPPIAEVFGQSLPPIAEEWSPQEVADLDRKAEAAIAREAARAQHVERFMLMPMAQKHRTTYIAVREVRDISIFLQREYTALAKDIAAVFENMAQRIIGLERQVEELREKLEPNDSANVPEYPTETAPSSAEPEPQIERQLSLMLDDADPPRG